MKENNSLNKKQSKKTLVKNNQQSMGSMATMAEYIKEAKSSLLNENDPNSNNNNERGNDIRMVNKHMHPLFSFLFIYFSFIILKFDMYALSLLYIIYIMYIPLSSCYLTTRYQI